MVTILTIIFIFPLFLTPRIAGNQSYDVLLILKKGKDMPTTVSPNKNKSIRTTTTPAPDSWVAILLNFSSIFKSFGGTTAVENQIFDYATKRKK